uniref:Uncharacterized protein n=1 Tax=Bursaphelenchus xylophilus TaxID=6326 RepID=A0A1I7S109_BURXY
MRGFVLLCLVLVVVDASGDKQAEIIRKITLVAKDSGFEYDENLVGAFTVRLMEMLNTISDRERMNISADISEQDNNVLSIKDNDPRGPEFDKVVRKAKQIRDNLIPVATRVENCNLRICYQYLKTMAKNKVNDRIRGNLK